jgi:hypothetical protein
MNRQYWGAVRDEVVRRNFRYLLRDGKGIPKNDAWLAQYVSLLGGRL